MLLLCFGRCRAGGLFGCRLHGRGLVDNVGRMSCCSRLNRTRKTLEAGYPEQCPVVFFAKKNRCRYIRVNLSGCSMDYGCFDAF